jgi:pentatricopeptide repeat protein
MRIDGVAPNDVTFICGLKACALAGAEEKGCEIHHEIERRGLVDRNIIVGTAVVDMYCKWGALSKALHVFDKLSVRDGVAWTALLTGYAQIGESWNVASIFERMVSEGVNPNPVTFLVLVRACCHCTSIFNKCLTYFEAMTRDFGINPTLEHHTCMVNFLGRAGEFEKAISMIKKMPSSPDHVMWHALMVTCQHWGNVEFGRKAFKEVLQLD